MQASPTPWTHPHDILFAVNPAKRRSFQRLALIAGLCALVAWAESAPRSELNRWLDREQHSLDVQKLEPTMRKLADAGKPDAMIWMAKNFPETDGQRLAPLVASGNAEAMMVLAAARWKNDKAGAERLLAAAAAQGSPDAVKYRITHLDPDAIAGSAPPKVSAAR